MASKSQLWAHAHPQLVKDRQRRYYLKDPRRRLLVDARARAKRVGRECTISLDDIVIPERCPVFGEPFRIGLGVGGHGPWSPSLDRKDPSLGYVPGNVQVISHRANMLKNNATVEEIGRLYEFMKGGQSA